MIMNLKGVIKEEINKSDKDIIGKELWFEYHCWESPESCDAELWYRSHQKVTVLNRGIDDHDEYTEEPKVYDVIFKDGFKGTVFADELMVSPQEFYRPKPNINESDELEWIKDTDPIEQLDYYYDNMFNEENINPDNNPLYFPTNRIIASKLLKKLEVDYDNMFSSTLTDICTWGLPIPSHEKYDSVSIVKRILCHDDFKKPEIKKLLKDYYKKRIKQLKKLLGQPSSTWETIKRYNPFWQLSDAIRTNQNVNESDELNWINDTMSNQDIAQEIADKTDIKDNEIDTPFTTKKYPMFFLFLPFFLPIDISMLIVKTTMD